MERSNRYRMLSIRPQQHSSFQANNQPASSEQLIPSPESMTDRERTLARIPGRSPREDMLKQVEMLCNWVRLIPQLDANQTPVFDNIISSKINAISNRPITGDEGEQLDVIHQLTRLQQEFRTYRGTNGQVAALFKERLKHLLKTEGTDRLPKESVPMEVTEVFKVKRFRILGIQPETTTHEIPNVRSLELSKKQTQYRLMVQNGLYKEFEGTTLRLDAVLYIRRDREQDPELVIFDMDEYDSFRVTLDSEEAADKLMHDVQLLTGTLEENTMRAQRLDAIRKRVAAKDAIA